MDAAAVQATGQQTGLSSKFAEPCFGYDVEKFPETHATKIGTWTLCLNTGTMDLDRMSRSTKGRKLGEPTFESAGGRPLRNPDFLPNRFWVPLRLRAPSSRVCSIISAVSRETCSSARMAVEAPSASGVPQTWSVPLFFEELMIEACASASPPRAKEACCSAPNDDDDASHRPWHGILDQCHAHTKSSSQNLADRNQNPNNTAAEVGLFAQSGNRHVQGFSNGPWDV
ncbi:uncharacterized protein LY79DRAFT_582310 [Colletotrichum navitas]|uniref:Uncharacterized protein n=1 Tax=Colletotrichum navitas TaxID=681940 RepID=A0AAD8PTL4_9PEZI|nr:uncharacterized protein LY79DRAFT_582310 [Colletotrichum navitas]KAK1579782.1 hypothetical protein LY79DRAFT_582310 [Colletotrichum navitas]